MRCIVKKYRLTAGVLAVALLFGGCGQEVVPEQPYGVYSAAKDLGLEAEKSGTTGAEDTGAPSFFASSFAVGGNEDLLAEGVTDTLSEAAGLFDMESNELLYARNIHERLYPASTTKLLTAYVAIRHGDLSATTTVSEQALDLESGSSVCGLSAGEVLSLEQLLYGLILSSGNDAANVIAEMISGSTEAFAELMNQEAKALGATNSHFVNAHGLPDADHYTTLYDLYLIARAVDELEPFQKVIATKSYEASYTGRNGNPVTQTWETTNQYLRGVAEVPEGVTVIGGKTGTTNEAGYCLVLYSQGPDQTPYISIVLKAESRSDLYDHMTELLNLAKNQPG